MLLIRIQRISCQLIHEAKQGTLLLRKLRGSQLLFEDFKFVESQLKAVQIGAPARLHGLCAFIVMLIGKPVGARLGKLRLLGAVVEGE